MSTIWITYSHTCVRSPNHPHIHLRLHKMARAPGIYIEGTWIETFPSILALSATSLVNIVTVSHAASLAINNMICVLCQ